MFFRKFSALAAALFIGSFSFAQTPNDYRYEVNLNSAKDDKVLVTLKCPKISKGTIDFHFPKMVPGTYKIYDFGRFATELKAFDKKGKELKVEHKEANTWTIKKAKKCATITYLVEDTWDTDKNNVIFEPAGTNIDKNVFVMNNHGWFGYFKGMEFKPYYINVDRPAKFFGATSLERKGGDKDSDIFFAADYHKLVDAPIMFCEPDTAVLQIGNCRVLISTYSPNKTVTSKYLASEIAPTLEAQRVYLGGTLPVDKYAFIIFLNPEGEMYLSNAAGALEHSYSSFYTLFEGEPEAIAQTIRDVSAHEFFHIVTPLSIHSEEIHYFDFINPKMSQHLWMYEGATEYAAHHAQVKGGVTTIEHFLNEVGSKMRHAEEYDAKIPFTTMSKGALDEHEKQYGNVYQQGALITMCLDMKLRVLSEGKYGTQELFSDLAKKYGIDKPFKDDELFAVIVGLTFPQVSSFFSDYVSGTKALPIKELMADMGITYKETGMAKELSPLGGLENPGALDVDMGTMMLKVKDESSLSDVGRDKFGFKTGDLLKEWNGKELSMKTVGEVLNSYAMSVKEGDEVEVLIMRNNKALTLKTTIEKTDVEVKHAFEVNPNPTTKQSALRKAWLGSYKSDK